jgi:hypothetical protein
MRSLLDPHADQNRGRDALLVGAPLQLFPILPVHAGRNGLGQLLAISMGDQVGLKQKFHEIMGRPERRLFLAALKVKNPARCWLIRVVSSVCHCSSPSFCSR